MQQRKNKSETEEKKNHSLAKMMLQRDKERLMAQQRKGYLELLKTPRGKEYLRLWAKTTELCQQLTDIEDEINQLELDVEGFSDTTLEVEETPECMGGSEQPELTEETEQKPAEETEHKLTEETGPEIKVTWLQGAENQKTAQQTQVQQKETSIEWMSAAKNKNPLQEWKKKKEKLAELKRQRDALVQELQTTQREFEAQLPVPDQIIGIIYPSINEEILIKYGVIACPGNSYQTPEELLEQVQPQSKQEEEQWLKGNSVYREHLDEELLLVEVYLKAICVVHRDGSTIVVE